MKKIMEKAGESVHSRDISIITYSAGDDSVVIEGTLHEKRLKEYYMISGEKRSPGTLHHMVIRLLIEGSERTIREIEVDMPGVPREECLSVINCLAPIKGMNVTQGFSQKVLEIAGGTNGCFHLVSLLLAMGPAVTQGFFANRATRTFSIENIDEETIINSMPVNSCKIWKIDGPLIRDIRKMLKDKSVNIANRIDKSEKK